MNVEKLISRSKFNAETFDLPLTLTDERLHPCIIEAQEVYLEPLLGSPLYYKLAKIGEVGVSGYYLQLLSGCEYTDPQGFVVSFPGLSLALVYWTLVRLAKRNILTFTSNNIVKKTSAHSVPLSAEEIATQIADFHSMASKYWTKALKFLNENATRFPEWKQAGAGINTSAPVKISAIGGETLSENYFCNDKNI
jgi:hypothetical protein